VRGNKFILEKLR